MRRLILTTTMALVAMAAAAVPALAQDLPPRPPHYPVAADWTAVNAVDWNTTAANSYLCDDPQAVCSFSDEATFATRSMWGGIQSSWSCSAIINGDVGSDGDIAITSYGADGCSDTQLDPAYLPASGEICMHLPTNEFWVRQSINDRPLYAQVLVQASGLATDRPTFYARGIMIGNPSVPAFADHYHTVTYGATAAGFRHAAFDNMWATSGANKLLLGQDKAQPACGWAELS